MDAWHGSFPEKCCRFSTAPFQPFQPSVRYTHPRVFGGTTPTLDLRWTTISGHRGRCWPVLSTANLAPCVPSTALQSERYSCAITLRDVTRWNIFRLIPVSLCAFSFFFFLFFIPAATLMKARAEQYHAPNAQDFWNCKFSLHGGCRVDLVIDFFVLLISVSSSVSNIFKEF